MKVVSVIPARGGSKGIKNKNLIDIAGKPLIQYSIDASLNSSVSETWVSSDSDDILSTSSELGAKVIKRDPSLAGDVIMPDATLVDFASKVDFDVLVFIQPTSPLITSADIDYGLEQMRDNQYDSVFTVTEEHWLPRWTDDVCPMGWDPKSRPRRQDMPRTYVENGMMYIAKREIIENTELRYGGKKGFIEIPLYRSFQVDSSDDLELIRKII